MSTKPILAITTQGKGPKLSDSGAQSPFAHRFQFQSLAFLAKGSQVDGDTLVNQSKQS